MDLESDCSAREPVEDNGLVQESNPLVDRGKVQDDGLCSDETDKLVSTQNVVADRFPGDHKDEKGLGLAEPASFGPLRCDSPGGASTPATKGYGLKKWKRIKRDIVKDTSANMESSKILKRGLSVSADTPSKPVHTQSFKIKENSEGSVGSVNLPKNIGAADGFTIPLSSPDSRFAMGLGFSAGTDSENSGDQGSKSLTAASAPKFRHDSQMAYSWDKHRVKNSGGKPVGHSAQKVKQGKGCAENSKKPREERIKIEKENSHSSIESDSRSSNFAFMQGVFSISNNGKQGERMNYDGENNDEAHAKEQTAYRIATVGKEAADISQQASTADVSIGENHCSSADQDLLAESMDGLLSVQEALEKEVENFQEIGKDLPSLHYDIDKRSGMHGLSLFANTQTNEPSSSCKLATESARQRVSISLESQILTLTDNVKSLESKLEVARNMLEVKTSRTSELEAALNLSKSLKEETGSTVELQQEIYKGIETELEGLFRQRIEAEIEFLTLKRSIEKSRAASNDQAKLFEEQKALAGEQAQTLNKLEETERKAAVLKKQAEELERHCGDILGTEEVLEMKRRTCKIATCFLLQLILLVLVVWLFVSRLSPDSDVVVPT